MWQRNSGRGQDEKLQNRFTAYLVTAVHRRKKDYIYMKSRQRQFEHYLEDWPIELGIESDIFDKIPLFMKLENANLIFALEQLNEKERYVLLTHVLVEKSFEDLGNELGLSYKGVASIYYRAIDKIRGKIKRRDNEL